MDFGKKVIGWLKPAEKKSDDGRDQWPSRTAFLLASVGGAVGQGNIIRYPSQVFNNIGLQWFVPYLIAIFILAIPCLILEVSIGQANRGGTVVAFNAVNRRMKGVGAASLLVSATVVVYFAIILVWIAKFFRHSFTSPLPWTGRTEEFYNEQVLANPDPIPGEFGTYPDGSTNYNELISYVQYPALGMLGETVGWSAFIWFCVWACMCGGVGVTGRAVYFTMALPIVMVIIILGRSVSLDNASEGIKLYFATWYSDKLADGQIWQTACGQVFFSTGVGFGYYISYASYNTKYANAVQDAFILVCSNCLFETVAAFAVFGVVGYLGINPDNTERLGAFEIGFLTFPAALVAMPGANFWSVLFFLTLLLLGISSTYPMLDVICTGIMDRWGYKFSRIWVATALVIAAFLISLMYSCEAGYYILDGIDRWINNLTLVFVVWSEVSISTSVYRWRDVFSEVGQPAYWIYNLGYFGGQLCGVGVAHAVAPWAGAAMGFGLYFVCAAIALVVARTPFGRQGVPKMFAKSALLTKLYYLAFYSGNQLRRDLNVIVGSGKNWTIPALWGPLLRYISSPILVIVTSFAYPEFYTLRNDPPYIVGFIIAHFVMLVALLGIVIPRYLDVFVPYERRNDGIKPTMPGVTLGILEAENDATMETGSGSGHASDSDRIASEKPPTYEAAK